MTKLSRVFTLLSALVAWSSAFAAAPNYSFTTLAGVAGAAGSNLNGTGGTINPTLFNNPDGLVVASNGNIYVTDTSNQVIRLIASSGEVSTFAGIPGIAGTTDGAASLALFNSPQGPAIDSSGNIYLADYSNNVIRKVTPAGVVSTFAGTAGSAGTTDGTGSAARFTHPKAVAIDSAGNLYVADAGNHTIRKITSAGVVTTFAGTAGSNGSTEGTGTAAKFDFPSGITVDGSGNVYVADTNNHTIRKITSAGVVSTLAGLAGTQGSTDSTTGTSARFYYPISLAMTPAGNIVVADFNNNTIRQVTPAGAVTTIAGSALLYDRVDGTGAAARFNHPSGVAVDSSGNIYVTDYGSFLIRKITSAGVVTTLAGTGGGRGFQNGTGTLTAPVLFNSPTAIAIDSSGTIYVADSNNSVIRKLTAAGVSSDWVGSSLNSGTADGTLSAARFSSPQAMAFDSSGNLYVTDSQVHTVRKVTSAGVVTTIAGTAGTSGTTDAVGKAALFASPNGIAVASDGTIYVADTGNHSIRKIATDGTVTTFAGTAGTSGSADGSGTAATFYNPRGLALDSSGNLFVADYGNHLIRKITSDGTVTTFAGSVGYSGSDDNTGTSASFNYPSSIVIDSSNNLYVTDSGSGSIRFITPAGVVTTIGGSGAAGAVDGIGKNARFAQTFGIARDSSGNLYIADSGNNSIRKGTITSSSGGTNSGTQTYTSATQPTGTFNVGDLWYQTSGSTITAVYRWNGSQWVQISSGDTGSNAGGSGSAAVFLMPASIAIDSSGNIYVADTGNHSIKKITSAGVGSVLAGTDGSPGSTDATGSAARFRSPAGVCVDSSGNVYVADTGNNTVRKITSAGVVTTLAGSSSASGSTDGTGSAASFNAPTGIIADASGNVYVTDATSSTVRKITSAGEVTTFAGTARQVGSADGKGTYARFNAPTGLAINSSSVIFLADTSNHTIRSLDTTPTVGTVAGLGGVAGAVDGKSFDALFTQPGGLYVSNYIYVADTGNNTIRSVTSSGYVATLAGVPGISGYRNSASGVPLFNHPKSVVTDSSGNIYVADTGNSVIRKIATDGTVTTLTPTLSSSGGSDSGSSGGGGGGGAPSSWFLASLAALAAARLLRRRS